MMHTMYSYSRKLVLLSIVALIMMMMPPASADLLYDHFGVTLELGDARTDIYNGGTYTPFASDTLIPTRHTHTTDYVVDDWYGSWDFTDESTASTEGGSEPGGGEPYDMEAIYFDNTETDLLVVIVTSFVPPPGYNETRPTDDVFIVTGDLALDIGLNDANASDGFSYDYGININAEVRPGVDEDAASSSTTIGDELYRTDNADWYVGTPTIAVGAGGELTNFDPDWASFGGSYVGDTSVSYYEYDFGGGAQECRYPTYIIEVTIPRSLLPDMDALDTVDIGWAVGCRNDGHIVLESLRFEDPPDIDTPEPGTLVLMGLGSLGMGWWKRRKKLAE